MSLKQNDTPRLTVELVPSTCHFSNVRTTVKAKEWDKIRFLSYEAAGHRCEICNSIGKDQGYKHDVECHEIWEYDDVNNIQKLIGLISLCPICHQVKHIGRAIAMGKLDVCSKQLAKVNNWTKLQVEQHIAESFEVYRERSKYDWKLDLSLLTEEPYSLNIDLNKERIFEIKKYKKKRRSRKRSTNRTSKPKKKFGKRPPKA